MFIKTNPNYWWENSSQLDLKMGNQLQVLLFVENSQNNLAFCSLSSPTGGSKLTHNVGCAKLCWLNMSLIWLSFSPRSWVLTSAQTDLLRDLYFYARKHETQKRALKHSFPVALLEPSVPTCPPPCDVSTPRAGCKYVAQRMHMASVEFWGGQAPSLKFLLRPLAPSPPNLAPLFGIEAIVRCC